MSRRYKPLYVEDISEDDTAITTMMEIPSSNHAKSMNTRDLSSSSSSSSMLSMQTTPSSILMNPPPPLTKKNHDEDYDLDIDPKIRHWKNSIYAVGIVEPTWEDELKSRKKKREARVAALRKNESWENNNNDDDDDEEDTTAMICDCACLYLSALVCTPMGAKRIGNMIVLKDHWVLVETTTKTARSKNTGDDDEEEDEEDMTITTTTILQEDEYECHSHNSDIVSDDNNTNNNSNEEEEEDDDYDNVKQIEEEEENNLQLQEYHEDHPTRKRKVISKQLEEEQVLPTLYTSSSTHKTKSTPYKKYKKINNKKQQSSYITTTEKKRHHVLDIVIGPFWPMLIFVTYPLIFGMTFLTGYFAIFIPNQKWFIVLVWIFLTLCLCIALFFVSCQDPGIMKRYSQPPLLNTTSTTSTNNNNSTTAWRWNQETLSYRPRDAIYDPECACIIEEYDHTCPWTGTAIGKKNMFAFQCFISFICICLVMDILLLTGATNFN